MDIRETRLEVPGPTVGFGSSVSDTGTGIGAMVAGGLDGDGVSRKIASPFSLKVN